MKTAWNGLPAVESKTPAERSHLIGVMRDRGPKPGDYCLSVRQPFASLIVDGYKPVENRSWKTDYRGPVWIHAALNSDFDRPDPSAGCPTRVQFLTEDCGLSAAEAEALDDARGAVVGLADLVDCFARRTATPRHLTGNVHVVGPWCLVFDRPFRITPVRMPGKLNLFRVPAKPAA